MAKVIVEYVLHAPPSGNEVLAPGDFLFQGSNDGVVWDTLDSQSVGPWLSGEVRTFNGFPNTTSYRHHRTYTTDTEAAPGNTSCGIRQMELHESIGGPDVTPTMTSDILPAPWVASADNEWSNYLAFCAFDDVIAAPYWMGAGPLPHWLAIDDGVNPPAPPEPVPWVVSDWNASDPAGLPKSGRMVKEDGAVAQLSMGFYSVKPPGSCEPGLPRTGRMIREDSSVVNIADLWSSRNREGL